MCSKNVEPPRRHVQDVGDALALELHLQGLAVVALALALFARDIDVGQEVHLDLDLAVSLAALAAAALDVEAKAARVVSALAGLLGLGKISRISSKGRCRWPDSSAACADGALIDIDHLVEWSRPGLRVQAWRGGAVQAAGGGLVKRTSITRVDLPHPQTPVMTSARQRDLNIYILQVILRRALYFDFAPLPTRLFFGTSTRAGRQVLPGHRFLDALDLFGGALGDDWAAAFSGAGPRSTKWSAARIVSSSCSTTITLLPMSRRCFEGSDEPRVVALVKADGGLVQDVEDADQGRADLRCQIDPLGFPP